MEPPPEYREHDDQTPEEQRSSRANDEEGGSGGDVESATPSGAEAVVATARVEQTESGKLGLGSPGWNHLLTSSIFRNGVAI